MDTRLTLKRLGQNILVVIDSSAGYLDILRAATTHLPQIDSKFFTLLCCYPTHNWYWEHGGADNPEAKQELEDVWNEEDKVLNRAEHCLNECRAILQAAGVPASHIFTRISDTEGGVVPATMHELKQSDYTGVIVSSYQQDIVNRLRRIGITDLFRRLPKVEVWAIDTKLLLGAQSQKE